MNLRRAIEQVYAAFASAPKPQAIDGCPCCLDDEEIATLLARPLRDITPDELSSYASSVFLTVGAEADYRYFLPRILEILVTDAGWWPDPEIVGRKLTLAKWSQWPAAERTAITQLFEVCFDALISASDGSRLDSWLCGLARAEIELQPFLDKLAAQPDAALAFYQQNAAEILDRRLGNAFWEDAPPDAMQQIVEWFYSTDISLLILKSYGVDLNLPQQ